MHPRFCVKVIATLYFHGPIVIRPDRNVPNIARYIQRVSFTSSVLLVLQHPGTLLSLLQLPFSLSRWRHPVVPITFVRPLQWIQ